MVHCLQKLLQDKGESSSERIYQALPFSMRKVPKRWTRDALAVARAKNAPDNETWLKATLENILEWDTRAPGFNEKFGRL